MALSDFEIAVGGITSIPVLGGLVWLSYKTWGERNLDASKLNAKKPQTPVKKQETKPFFSKLSNPWENLKSTWNSQEDKYLLEIQITSLDNQYRALTARYDLIPTAALPQREKLLKFELLNFFVL